MGKIFVFDLDGTLVDSVARYSKAFLSVLDEEGISYGEDTIKVVTPMGYPGSAEYYVDTLGVRDTKEHVLERLINKVVYEYTYQIYTKPGVKEYLSKLREQGARLFVLTASPHILTDPCLKHNEIFDWFETVWSTDDFELTKSDPRIFFKVAEAIGCKPSDVHYFDDSMTAIENAKKAGFITYGVYDAQTEEDISLIKREYDGYVASFAEWNLL